MDIWNAGVAIMKGSYAIEWLPHVYSISGNTTTIIACFKSTHDQWGVYMYFTTSGVYPTAWTQLTTDDVEIPAGCVPLDMVFATVRDGTSVGKIFLYIADDYEGGSSDKRYVKVFTLPASEPYTSGTWTTVTPDYWESGTTYSVGSGYCHTGLAVVERTGTETDDVFVKAFGGRVP